MGEKAEYVDILEPRKRENPLQYMSKAWKPQAIRRMDRYYNPQQIKYIVANSTYMDSVIESISSQTGVAKDKLRAEMLEYLQEIGFGRKMWVARWLGVILLKLTSIMNVGVYVNEKPIDELKKSLGNNPVLLLPTHRSYADFCLTTYYFYHYDMELPVIAAGLDFYNMAVMGQAMRDVGAFYIRRTLSGSDLYAHTLRHYVRTAVSKYNAPVQFFVEGTRSRSNKCLPPKYGMLSWALLPLFAGEVPDVTLVPMNISYERLVEHNLFAYEHLGVPKPKEALGALLKSLHNLIDNYGNVYMTMGSPFSAKEYFKDLKYNIHQSNKPQDLQKLTTEQLDMVAKLGDRVVALQQEHTLLTITTIVAILLMDSLIRGKPLHVTEVEEGIEWLVKELAELGAKTDLGGGLQRILRVHRTMMKMDSGNYLRLLSVELGQTADLDKKMEGHKMSWQTMSAALPLVSLQVYVNPAMSFLAPPALITALVDRGAASQDELRADYFQLRKLLKHEYFYCEDDEPQKFSLALEYCVRKSLVSPWGGAMRAGGARRLRALMTWPLWPALATSATCAHILMQKKVCSHREALELVQARAEEMKLHPYCLSLEAAANCLQGLLGVGAATKKTLSGKTMYEVNPSVMSECQRLISSVLPALQLPLGRDNPVIHMTLAPSRL